MKQESVTPQGVRCWQTRARTAIISVSTTRKTKSCLLYTSDAADDLTRVDLGGRRIIKKNFFKQKTAYEITTRLVGSEMCIRDSTAPQRLGGEMCSLRKI